jgi:hypothetical protein
MVMYTNALYICVCSLSDYGPEGAETCRRFYVMEIQKNYI